LIGTIAPTAVSLTQSIELSVLAKATVMLALGLATARLAVRVPASARHLNTAQHGASGRTCRRRRVSAVSGRPRVSTRAGQISAIETACI
jgi:hypothetical protein